MSILTRVAAYLHINPTSSTADSDLDVIRDARGNIDEIRLLLKGNIEVCQRLFKEAVEKRDVISQIQLSQAYFAIKWGKDQEKDFSSLSIHDLEKFFYYPKDFALFKYVYNEIMGVGGDSKRLYSIAFETFSLAADMGYLPAVLELKATQWKLSLDSYGFAVQLRPFVGNGDKQLDYYFGLALKAGSPFGSEHYYEGLYWQETSCGIYVKYPKEGQSFEEFKRRYIQSEIGSELVSEYDGLLHIGSSIVLAPSREAWETFKREKLTDVKIANLDSYIFAYDPEEIKILINQYKISFSEEELFIKDPVKGYELMLYDGTSGHGFCVSCLSIFEGDKKIDEISVRKDVREIHQTFREPRIQPIIAFIENVMIRSGSAKAAYSWLRKITK